MKKTGRVIGVLFTTTVGIAFFLYYYFIIGSAWKCQAAGAVICSIVAWWLGGFYDKATFYAKELERKTKELEASKEELQHYFDSGNIAIWEYGLAKQEVHLSLGVSRILGFSPKAISVPTRWPDAEYVYDDDREILRHFVNEFLSGSYAKIQLRIVPPDDRDGIRWVEACANPIYIDGVFTKVIGSLTDITDEKNNEEMLRRSDKLHVIGELASGVAHEIRNPLTTIRGFMQLIRPKVEEKRYLDIVLEEIDRINQIVSELLVMAKPYAAQFHARNVLDLIRETVSFMQPQLILHSVQVTMEAASAEAKPMVICEENQLKQVFINVIKNAIEAMPGGGEIGIGTETTGANITIRIADQGCGIESDRLGKVGMPFHTTKENGTGLGLMVSNKIIQNHNGSLTIASVVNQGTTVTIVLPAAQESPSPA